LFSAEIVTINNEKCALSIINNITERKKSEEIIENNNSRLQLAMSTANMAWWEMDLTTGNVIFDKRKAEMLGYPPEKFKHYTDFVTLVHPEDREKAMIAMRVHLSGEKDKYEIEYRILTNTGKYEWFYDIGSVIGKDENGKPLKVTGLAQNISERKNIEIEINSTNKIAQEYEYFLEKSQEVGKIGSFKTDYRKQIFTYSKTLYSIFGINENYDRSITGWQKLIHHDDRKILMDYFNNEVIAKKLKFEKDYRIVRQNDKQTRWVHGFGDTQFDENGNITQMFGTIQDITEYKLAQEKILQLGKYYQTLIEKAPDGIILLNAQGQFTYISPSANRMFGYEISEEPNVDPNQITHPDDLPMILTTLAKIMADANYTPTLEYRVAEKNGQWKWIESTFSNLLGDPNVGSILINFRDISERMLAQNALKESEIRFRKIFDQAAIGVVLIDSKTHRFVQINQKYCDFVGYTKDELLQKSFIDITWSDDIQKNIDIVTQFVAGTNTESSIEKRYVRKDGTLVWGKLTISPLWQVGETPQTYFHIAIVEDINQRKQSEKQLQDLAKFPEENTNPVYRISLEGTLLYSNPAGNPLIHEYFQTETDKISENWVRKINDIYNLQKNVREEKQFGDYVYHFELIPLIGDNYVNIYGKDITELKHLELWLKQSEEKYRIISENAKDWIFLISAEGELLYSSPSCLEITGYSASEFENNPNLMNEIAFLKDDIVLKNHSKIIHEDSPPDSLEYQIITKSGELRWIHHSCYSVYNSEGKYIGRQGTNQNIYERKVAEIALKDSEERFRTVFNQAAVGVAVLDSKTGQYVRINKNYCDFLGYSESEMLQKTFKDVTYCDDIQENTDNIEKFINGRQSVSSFEKRYVRKDGQIVWGNHTISPLWQQGETPQTYFHVAIVENIDARKHAVTALKESEAKFRSYIESALDGIFVMNADGYYLDVNVSACKLLQYSFDELLHMHASQIVTQKDISALQDSIGILQQTGKFQGEINFVRKDGSFIIGLLSAVKISENVFLVFLKDNTQHKMDEIALKESEEKYRILIENANEAIYVVQNEHIVFVNAVCEQLTGNCKEDLLGLSILELIDEDFQDNVRQHLQQLINEKLTSHNSLFEIKTAKGKKRWISVNAVRIVWEGFPATLNLASDITERILAENEIRNLNLSLEKRVEERTEQLLRANKDLESFAYSVSHDLRAPLRHIDGFARMLQTTLKSESNEVVHYLNVINNSSQKMGEMIDSLLNFSRLGRTSINKIYIDLNTFIGKIISGFENDIINRNVEWTIGKLPVISADYQLLMLVFENLISNALKYTAKKKIAKIEIGNYSDNSEKCIIFIKDNGVGFAPEYADKLFGVFQRLHTEKEFEGIGIGLANAKQIIEKHGGKIWAKSILGEGATFYISL
jgi:PAS domain S-box-containing protein